MEKEIMKIPIFGVQNAGKTSLIRTLQHEFSAISKLKPTKGIDRQTLNLLGKKILIWDLGGQAKYRDQHLEKKAEVIFSDIDQALYVVDIQDQDSFEASINYFKQVRDRIADYSPEAKIHILIHKFDPGMEQSPENMKLLEVLKKKFTEIANPIKINLNHTSIFNPISVIHAFSKPILGDSTLYDNLGILFDDFCNKNQNTQIIDFIIIFSEDLVEVASYFQPNIEQIKLRDVAHKLFQKFTKKTMTLKEITFQTEFTMVEMKQFNSNNRRFFFTYGYGVSNSSNIGPIRGDIEGLLEAVKKLMIYF
ncbi:MAG: ADP-ribosylation factor-like protein [Promethearchaeota archaeon]